MRRPSKRTQADMIREVLSDRIVHGILQPDEALDETGLAAEFGVSRTPIREALRQLETIGLARSRPHRGTVVTNLPEGELHDIFRVMGELEALCARLCAEAMTPDEREALSHLQASGAALVLGGDVDGYRIHNDRFHDALYAGSHNGFLEDTTRSVRRRLAPFRWMQFETLHRIADSQREHGTIVAAILDGGGDLAARSMREHMSIVERAVDRISPVHYPDEDGAHDPSPIEKADLGAGGNTITEPPSAEHVIALHRTRQRLV